MSVTVKVQPWKSFPRNLATSQDELTAEELNMQRSYGTHASNTKGRIFTIEKAQPWKAFPRDLATSQDELTAEELNMQRSYGTHASNTKGRIFTIEDKPSK
ncbi:hypothetical protein LX32DRAFT_690068 [Colletotrichum zoysiae]|uniref:Uncharacterized protein n=1 Tax=Colletotrichum zoysiae TaxID=1216348 RepID=A0AAD9HSP7_9PEZI|nr:hypothetical protein LX32DRAFT_690068 [Colletotrichum zoysiae]